MNCIAGGVERRDQTVRALRNAVAAWFSVHPASLARLDTETVELMFRRLEGRRQDRTLAAGDVGGHPLCGHPWAG